MSWQLISFLILGGALAAGFAWYERSRPPARVLALVAALAALAVVGRLAFAAFPNVKPTTDIVLFSGYALGGAPGFAVGAVTALVSNIFFAHGPWTPWQMAAWGGVGIAGGVLGTLVRRRRDASGPARDDAPRELGRWPLALACGLAGLGFGVVMDFYMWTLGAEQTPGAYAAIAARSLPFNVAHIAGNVVFCLLIGPQLVRALRRYRRRFEVHWHEVGASTAAPVASVVVVAVISAAISLAGAPAAEAASASERAARYLEGSQNRDGGFGASRGSSSTGTQTGEVGLGLAAAGRNPQDVTRGGNSVIDWTKRNIGSVTDVGAIERTILLVRAAGLSPRRFAGRNLYAELLDHREGDGSFRGNVSYTASGIQALRAAGERSSSARMGKSADWLSERQNPDGGFSLAPGPGNADITGQVLQALAAAGRARGPAARDGVAFLDDAQAGSGGFGQTAGRSPNAQSTAWAVQGLVAARHGGGATVRDALSYLRSRQADDGSVPYDSQGGSRVWATGQAEAALNRQAFPLDPVPRRPPAEEPGPADPKAARGDGGVAGRAGGGDRARDGRSRAKREPRALGAAGGGAPGPAGFDAGGSGVGAIGPAPRPGGALGTGFAGAAPKGLGGGSGPGSAQDPKSAAKSLGAALSSGLDGLAAKRPAAARRAERAKEDRAGGALLWSLLSLVAVAGVAAGGVAVRRLLARRGTRSAPPGAAQPERPLVSKT